MKNSIRAAFALSLAGLIGLAASGSAGAQTRAQLEQFRHKLVDEILVPAGLKNPRVIKAMKDTPRHEFVEAKYRSKAYYDMALPIGEQQTISSPLIVSQMTQALDPQPGDKVLEIGTGSGYQAAVLSPLVKEVYTIEIVKSLGESAQRTLRRLGYRNVFVKIGDGYQGWPEHAPFDKIIVTCSPEKVPQPLVEQLADGGLMVIPVGERYSQTLYLLRKRGGQLESEALLPTLFVPMTGQAEEQRAVKPDPANPRIVNGSFEEDASQFTGGAQSGWYYERQVAWKTDASAPDGSHYVEFKNTEPGLDAHLLQGFAIDGRQVAQLEVSGWVKTDNVVAGPLRDQNAFIALSLYDEQRRELGILTIGPFTGTSAWREESKTFRIPPAAREGILRIGLFGATGTAAFDKLEIRKVVRP
jgi:protein-L-isoaspartate(D-aspartate) O-methyltransferase